MYNSAKYTLIVLEYGTGKEALGIEATLSIDDTGQCIDENLATAETDIFIDSDNKLMPLGVYVLRDSREELLPGTREITEIIPGKHGEIDFGSEFEARILELYCITPEGLTPQEKAQLKRQLAKKLNPVAGNKRLIFFDDLDKMYSVKYAGKIDLTQYPGAFEFTIPFKMSNPFIVSAFENKLVGSGTITNEGTFETPLVIEIQGPVTNPTVTVGEYDLSYTGDIVAGQTLIIDTGLMTVTLDGQNALGNFTGDIEKVELPPGETIVTAAAGGTTTFKWRDCWL